MRGLALFLGVGGGVVGSAIVTTLMLQVLGMKEKTASEDGGSACRMQAAEGGDRGSVCKAHAGFGEVMR